ncbi:MAG TPA: cellulose biosynthesis cyclic di-GMP-binding regulatory protein BcsB [Azospirillaceae bacterium]|nr:cellulose biosynthesis cyclic di-GMP-binding regulatory protein BcsB [Azospirillaceae bacterium]
MNAMRLHDRRPRRRLFVATLLATVPFTAAALGDRAVAQTRPSPVQGPAQAKPEVAAPDARTDARTGRPEPAVRTETRAVPLATASVDGGPLVLRGQRGELRFALTLPAGTEVRRATLRLAYNSADTLVPGTSRLWTYLNDSGLAELPLDGQAGAVRAEMDLPPAILRQGTNRLSLLARQDHRRGCDARWAGELWTSLDPSNSFLILETARADVPPTLADLRDAAGFLMSRAALPVLTAGRTDGPAAIAAGALVAQGFALRMGDQPPSMRNVPVRGTAKSPAASGLAGGNRRFPGLGADQTGTGHAVLIGTRSQLEGLVSHEVLARIEGPFLGIYPQDANPDFAVLLVAGRTEDEVVGAAATFADPGTQLPAQAWMAASGPGPGGNPAAALEPGRTYALADLRVTTGTAGNGSEASTTVELPLPHDMFAADNRKARLHLSFAYGPGLARDSVLNIRINDDYVGVVPLDNPEGAVVRDLPVDIPVNRLRPGMNRLVFEPLTGGQRAGVDGCSVQPVGTGGSVGIFAESRLHLPEAARVAHQPDLRLFGSSGFPYTHGQFSLRIGEADPDTLSAAWNLVARMAQAARRPLLDFDAAVGWSATPHNVLAVGTFRSLEAGPLAAGPDALRAIQVAALDRQLANSGGARIEPRLLTASLMGQDAAAVRIGFGQGGMLGTLEAFGHRIEGTVDAAVRLLHGRVRDRERPIAADGPEPPLALAAFESPFRPRRTVTLVAAAEPAQLAEGVRALVAPALWDRLTGDLASWQPMGIDLRTAAVSPTFRTAPLADDPRQIRLYVNSMFALNPGLWLVASLVVVVVFAGATWLALAVGGRR